MHQTSWVHRHLQACNFVFDPGWRRHRREWCVHQLFAGRFQDYGAYQKWRVHLWRRRAVRVRRRRRRDDVAIYVNYTLRKEPQMMEMLVFACGELPVSLFVDDLETKFGYCGLRLARLE